MIKIAYCEIINSTFFLPNLSISMSVSSNFLAMCRKTYPIKWFLELFNLINFFEKNNVVFFLIIFFIVFFAFMCLNNFYWVIISVIFILLQWASNLSSPIKIPHWRLLFAMRAIKKEYLSRDFNFRTYNVLAISAFVAIRDII